MAEVTDLARQLVRHPRFRWSPGMRYSWLGDYDRVHDAEPGELRRDGSLVPDLTDAATAGVLLDLLGDRLTEAVQQERLDLDGTTRRVWLIRWRQDDGRVATTRHHPTLGEAVARALLAVWGPA